eukprot:GHVS01036871.1.p1 GENE.GHVS01036871.1~~GHVS01036871.1.p1  ORF type:complete len:811 (+),score=147.83 GHVS01036871.1:204-2636(+)
MIAEQTIYLARHGEPNDLTDLSWYEGNKCAGWIDPQLSVRGMMQARDLGRHLSNKGVAQVYSSPFLRSVQTAMLACEMIEGFEDKVRVELGLSECMSLERLIGSRDASLPPEPFKCLVPPKLLVHSVGENVDSSYVSMVVPSCPETLPIMNERSRLFLSTLLSSCPPPHPTLLFFTHASVIESLVAALVPGTRFPRGIDLCSVTELRVQRDDASGNVIATTAVRTADAEFVKCKAEYELGTTGFRFAKKPFPPRGLIGDLCAPELDMYEDRVVSLPVEALAAEELEEGRDFQYDADGSAVGLTPQGSRAIDAGVLAGHAGVAELPKKVKMDPKRRAFVAFADETGRIPMEKAIYLAHYYGLAPSREDIQQLGQVDHLAYGTFLQFLKSIQHPEDQPEAIALFFEPFDPTNSGLVSRVTFESFLTLYGDKLTQQEIDSICKQYNVDSNKINYREFVTKLLTAPELPELEVGEEYEEVGGGAAAARARSQVAQPPPPAVAAAAAEPVKVLDSMQAAFESSGKSKEDKMSTEEAAANAKKLGLSIQPKDLGDFRTTVLGDRDEVDYDGFVALVSFVRGRHTVFEAAAGSDKTVATSEAGDLAKSSFGLKNKPAAEDMRQFATKSGKQLTYEEFLRFCEFAEHRQMAFAALAVGSPGGRSRIPSEKAGFLANKFGFAPAVNDIHRYQEACGDSMSYDEFMHFLEECRHKEDSDVDSMEAFFKPYDATATGYVPQKVFRNLLFMFGESYTTQQIDVIVRDICGNSDPVNYLSFINKVLSTPTDDTAVNPLVDLRPFATKHHLVSAEPVVETVEVS